MCHHLARAPYFANPWLQWVKHREMVGMKYRDWTFSPKGYTYYLWSDLNEISVVENRALIVKVLQILADT